MPVEAGTTTQELELSPFQQRVMAVPEDKDLCLAGGRGGGKSYGLALLGLRHAEQYREKARVLFVRQSFPGAADFISLTRSLFGSIYGQAATFNGAAHVWTLPNDAYFEIGMLHDVSAYSRYQGRSFNLLLIDEAGQWSEPNLLDMLRSNLRGPEGVPVRVCLAANPGDVGHQWIAQRYIFKAAPWVPFIESKSGREFVTCPSTFVDNPYIAQDDYRKQVEAATATDPELGRAWLAGDWTVARGAYFAGVLEESRNAIDPWPTPPDEYDSRNWWYAPVARKRPSSSASMFRSTTTTSRSIIRSDWRFTLSHDYGSAAPSVTYVVAESPGGNGPDGRFYPRGSLILIDELATCDPESPSRGMGYTVPHLSELIIEMCKAWQMRPVGVCDDACFARMGSGAGSIAEEFKKSGVVFKRARKADRLTGWAKLKRLLADAGKVDVPGLYVARNCEYFWQTVPYLGRDPRRVEDLDTRQADHSADCVRYAVTGAERSVATYQTFRSWG